MVFNLMNNGSIGVIFILVVQHYYVEKMSYATIDALLGQYDADLSAAQAQGMASGLLAVNINFSGAQWLEELLRHSPPINDEHKAILEGLFEDTQDVLLNDEFEFEIFLPEAEDSNLVERVEALREWCKGLLLGVGFANTATQFSIQTQEILKDVAEMTKLDSDIALDDEEAENDFMELTEYLRAAVLALRDNFTEQ